MQQEMMKDFIKKVAILAIISQPVYASPYIGVTAIDARIKDPQFIYKNKPQDSVSFTVGWSKEFKNKFSIALQTNRLTPSKNFDVISRETGVTMQSKSKVTNDTILVGYRLKRLSPSIFISNAQVHKALSYKGEVVGKEVKSGFVYGFNLNYFLTRHLTASIIEVEPNKEFYLERSFGVGLSYLF